MKIKFLATGIAPKKYEFKGEVIIVDGVEYDLSEFREDDTFEGMEGDIQAIRDIKRIDGELHLILCQKAPPGHWRGINEWIDSETYNSERSYIKEVEV